MDEITKLYKNAGIENELQGFHCHRNWDICENEHKCKICKHSELIYSVPFTAEKQIELIKWISHHDGCFKVYLNSIEFGDTGFGSCFTFEESLAKAVSNFLMSATDKEKQQIKEILE